jgi:integrase
MLTIYRRHRAGCKCTSRRAKCFCPIWVQGILRGEEMRKSLDLTNWEAAAKLVRDWEIERPREVPPVGEASKRFLDDLGRRGLSPDTIQKFALLTRELCAEFSGWLMDRFTPDDVGKFTEGWTVKPITAQKKLERLRQFFRFCEKRKWIEDNPATDLAAPKQTSVEKKPYEADELEKIAWAIPLFPIKGIYGERNRERIRAFVAVLQWTGLRIRDVVQLKRSAVQNGFITVRTHKNGKPVQLPVHPDIEASLPKGFGEYFFWNGESNPKSCVGDWQRTLRRLGVLAGVHIHAHRWRHTFATQLLSKGVPVSEVAAILGNSPRIIEKHYSQWIQARQDSVNAAVKGTW